MQPSNNLQTGTPLIGELTPGRLGENTAAVPGLGGSAASHLGGSGTSTGAGTYTGTGTSQTTNLTSGTSGLPTSGTTTGTGGLPGSHTSGTSQYTGVNGTGVNGTSSTGLNGTGPTGTGGLDKGTHGVSSHTGHTHSTHTPGSHTSATGPAAGAAAGAATGAGLGHHHGHHHGHGVTDSTSSTTPGTGTGTGTSVGQTNTETPDFTRRSGMPGQEVCGNHTVPGMESAGTGYAGPHAKRGDISAPTGSLPAGTVEKGATNQAIPRPSAKDFFKMSNAGTPAAPQALANRPVHQDPISEADHVAPDHGGHMGTPGDMKRTTPTVREEGVNAYAAGAHGDHLVHGLSTGTGYAGATAARGDTTAPTGSLPPGTIEAGAQNQAIPRPSAKDQFLINNAATPSNPVSLAKRMFKDGLGIGKAPTDSK